MVTLFVLMAYVIAVIMRLTSREDTPVWTWPALAMPILLGLGAVLYSMYNIFLLFLSFMEV
jgi:hypothetical protein